jgi:hypothetical protein
VIEHGAVRGQAPDLLDQLPARGLATQDEAALRQSARRVVRGHQSREMRGHDLQAVHGVAAEVLREGHRAGDTILAEDVQRAAGGQGREEHRVAEVGGEG